MPKGLPPAAPPSRSFASVPPSPTALALADSERAIAIAEDRRDAMGVRRFLESASARDRARAAFAAGRLQDSTLVSAVVALLDDTSATVRHEAMFALGQIGHAGGRAPLERWIGEGGEGTELVIEALAKIGNKASTRLIANDLRDPAPRVRAAAAVALWRLADSTALDRLIERHDDPDPEVRWRVIYAMEKIVAPDRVVLVTALHMDDPDWRVRAHAARTLGRQKSARAMAYLLQKLGDPEPAVAVNVIRALQLIADSTSTVVLRNFTGALSHPHPYVRVTAAAAMADRFAWVRADTALRRIAVDSLTRRLHDPDAATRGAAARALVARLGARGWTLAAPLLEDSSVYVRAAVVRAAGLASDSIAGPLLLERLRPGHALLERIAAGETMGTRRIKGSVGALRSALGDTSVLVSATAAGALADMGDTASVKLILRAWGQRAEGLDADARIGFQDAVTRLGGRAAADSLQRAHPQRPPAIASYPAGFELPPSEKGAVIRTTAGPIEIAFYGREATQTVKNFMTLARRGWFNNVPVHRVVPDFVIQDGDPTGTGSGGPGYSIRCEYNRLHYDAGMVGMALSGKDTGGSQWFITQSPQPHLDGRYTIFAHVTAGLDVVTRVVQGDKILGVDIR